MKALRIIGIIVGVLVAAILIIPLFAPNPVVVSAETEIALEPAQIFPSVASFDGRDSWDPWLTNDSTATAEIVSKPGFVGSTYAWDGEAVSYGRMEVISVKENEYIESHLWFGPMEDPALVEWEFSPVDGGTRVVWSFTQETLYPFNRLGMMIGAGFLENAFVEGLANLKEEMEANPPSTMGMGAISVESHEAFEAMVAGASGTMQELSQLLPDLYMKVFTAIGTQGLEVAGPAFIHYLDFDEATNSSNFLAGAPVTTAGTNAGEVMAKSYPAIKAVQGLHMGPYENFPVSYGKLNAYAEANNLEVSGEALEIYQVGMQETQDPAQFETLIVFPLK